MPNVVATITVELEAETETLLVELEQRTGEKRADLLRNALRNGVEDSVEYFSAAATLERIEAGTERVYSSEEVRRSLGLDN